MIYSTYGYTRKQQPNAKVKELFVFLILPHVSTIYYHYIFLRLLIVQMNELSTIMFAATEIVHTTSTKENVGN